MNKKQKKRQSDYIHRHLIEAIDVIVKIDMSTKSSSHLAAKLRVIRKIINSYKNKNKGVIEF